MMRPHLTPEAMADVRAAVAINGADFEVTFCGQWDALTRTITGVTPLFFGNDHETRICPEWFAPGDIALHTHPIASALTPSTTDLDNALSLRDRGVGAAVLSHEPAPPPLPRPRFRTRVWALGPLALLWTTPTKGTL
jgi:hypothetical protein